MFSAPSLTSISNSSKMMSKQSIAMSDRRARLCGGGACCCCSGKQDNQTGVNITKLELDDERLVTSNTI